MELMLQFGWGMMEHCRFLVRRWGAGTVILSPRDMSGQQMMNLSEDVAENAGTVLIDPQLYVPHTAHARLTAHAYWPRSPVYWRDPAELSRVVDELIQTNDACGARSLIAPSPIATAITNDSLLPVSAAIEELGRRGVASDRIIATVALSADAIRNEDRAEALSDAIERWEVNGIYLIAEHPNNEYLVADPMWIARMLDIIAGARLVGKTVIVGYSSHQMLIAACAGANAIASGSWLNVRQFSPTRFDEPDEDEISRRATWYYAPHLLSEFKIPFLDIAWRLDLLNQLRTPQSIEGSFADGLFAGGQPTSADFSESSAFRHYLNCLRQQVAVARRETYEDTLEAHEKQLADSDTALGALRQARIVSQGRAFTDAGAANNAALALLHATRGPLLSREWKGI